MFSILKAKVESILKHILATLVGLSFTLFVHVEHWFCITGTTGEYVCPLLVDGMGTEQSRCPHAKQNHRKKYGECTWHAD